MAYTTIDKPSDYFETLLSTGDGGSQTFTGLDFQPDWVWSKRRQTHVHQLYDSVRTAGSGKALQSDATAAEGGDGGTYGYLSSFTSDGFASTAGSSNNNYFNADGGTYVFWNWKAGTAFSNDASSTSVGTIDSAGSVNTDAGFSITTFTGTGSAGSVAHGLGAIPKFLVVKSRSNANGWIVYHGSLGAGKGISLNLTDAAFATGSRWNSTEPTSTVFTLGSAADVNRSGGTHVCYAFAEKKGYSKFGSYTGNGNADGSFVFLGFKPAFIIIKKSSNAGNNWYMWDNKRNTFNLSNTYLNPDLNAAEGTQNYGYIDFLSNGFKTRATGNTDEINQSGHTFIYLAFAENPFVTSTGVPATAR